MIFYCLYYCFLPYFIETICILNGFYKKISDDIYSSHPILLRILLVTKMLIDALTINIDLNQLFSAWKHHYFGQCH